MLKREREIVSTRATFGWQMTTRPDWKLRKGMTSLVSTQSNRRENSSARQIRWFGGYSHHNFSLSHQKIVFHDLTMQGGG